MGILGRMLKSVGESRNTWWGKEQFLPHFLIELNIREVLDKYIDYEETK
jgi:hypothetical protein